MTDWSQLEDAYGSAEEIPALLDQLVPAPEAEVWDELWSRLCHQGTVYSASFAALPRLTEAAASWDPADRITVLALTGAIVTGANGARHEAHVREQHAKEVATLTRLAEECLNTPAALADDPDGFVYVLGALLAFEGVTPWDEKLEGLAAEEYEAECPDCEAALFISLGEEGFFACHEDYALHEDVPRTPLLPATPSDLDGLARRLYTTAGAADQQSVATKLLHLFGKATCTECATVFVVADQVPAV